MQISEILTSAPKGDLCAEEQDTFALLDRLGIPFTAVRHDTAETMEDCAAVSDVLDVRICKNLFLCNRQKTEFYLLAMPEDKPFHTKDLSRQIGSSRLSFAPPEDMVRLLGCHPGSASVLGLANDAAHQVRLLMDRPVAEAEWFGCHPCKNDCSLRLKTADLRERFLPFVRHDIQIVDLPLE
jgi:Ala-tRNA(Pro) deacylase